MFIILSDPLNTNAVYKHAEDPRLLFFLFGPSLASQRAGS